MNYLISFFSIFAILESGWSAKSHDFYHLKPDTKMSGIQLKGMLCVQYLYHNCIQGLVSWTVFRLMQIFYALCLTFMSLKASQKLGVGCEPVYEINPRSHKHSTWGKQVVNIVHSGYKIALIVKFFNIKA